MRKSQGNKSQIKVLQNLVGRNFYSEYSSIESNNSKMKPSKIAQLNFIRKIRTIRRKNRYLTEDEQSSESLNVIKSCVQEQQCDIQQLERDFKRKFNHEEVNCSEIKQQPRKIFKQNQNDSNSKAKQEQEEKNKLENVNSQKNNL